MYLLVPAVFFSLQQAINLVIISAESEPHCDVDNRHETKILDAGFDFPRES